MVRTDVACYLERLVKMGWQPDDEAGTFTRRLDRAAASRRSSSASAATSRPWSATAPASIPSTGSKDWGCSQGAPSTARFAGGCTAAARSRGGAGIPIEQGDLDPPHEDEDAAEAHLELVSWHGLPIAVPHLGLQLAVAERRGLSERAARIREAMRP
ncbi:MAG: hypothetical protein M0Z82_18930 [Actinomycetota bacterium]|nr:hypothetical protein [Actinomycetota bacterium]